MTSNSNSALDSQAKILLASSSPYRKQLLQRLGLNFECQSPQVDESQQPNESVEQMVIRLAKLKAQALVTHYPNHIIIASDQSASLAGQPLGKAGQFDQALQQLQAQQGQKVTFFTSLALYNPRTQDYLTALDQTHVQFRQLDNDRLSAYLKAEKPYDCAGSFKSEGLGVMLFNAIETQDPNALIGLPMIQLVHLLEKVGVPLPA